MLASGMPPEAACPAPLLAEAVFADMPDGVKFRSFAVPAQPIQRRERLGRSAIGIDACVARPVSHKERRENPKAQASLDKEWKKLRDINCWEEGKVKEWRDVAAQARNKGTQCHVGRIFAICVEKNAELPESDPSRKFKGRVVFQGNNVRDHNWEVALFQELGSCPATLEAAKVADLSGLVPGHKVEQADAEQAYTQSLLGGTPTWVRLPVDQWLDSWFTKHDPKTPKEFWPVEWRKYHDPVCPLRLALYGHPDSGGYWEQHCERHLKSIGFVPVPEWPSCFWHEEHKCLLVVYVDDFKLSGPAKALPKLWAKIRSGLKIGETTPMGLYLGCYHDMFERVNPRTGAKVRVLEYNMESFLRQCVERYKTLSGVTKLKYAATPFFDDRGILSEQRKEARAKDVSSVPAPLGVSPGGGRGRCRV